MMGKKTPARNILPVLILGMLLGAAAALAGCRADAATGPEYAQPVAEMTAVWGSFDEIRLFRYFGTDSQGTIPDRASYGGKDYILAGTDGPFETQWGVCLEAMYAEEQDTHMK